MQVAAAAVESCETALDVVRRAVEAAEAERIRTRGGRISAVGTLRAAEAAFTRLSAEESALARWSRPSSPADAAFLTLSPSRPAASRRWRRRWVTTFWRRLTRTRPPAGEHCPYANADARPLPMARSLAPLVRAPDLLTRRLNQTGIVDSTAEGDRLQPALYPDSGSPVATARYGAGMGTTVPG